MVRARSLLALSVVLSGALVLGIGSVAKATQYPMIANLDGLQEVPPNASPGFGSIDGTYDDSTMVFTITSGSYQDLLGNSTAVTLNNGAIGANGPILAVLTLDAPGTMTGTVSGASGALTPANGAALLAENTYINIRSNVFPSGEIRGQLFLVPEPASLGLLGMAGASLLARRRR